MFVALFILLASKSTAISNHPCQTLIANVCTRASDSDCDFARKLLHLADMKHRTVEPPSYAAFSIEEMLALPSCPRTCPQADQPSGCAESCWRDIQKTQDLETKAVQVVGELCYINREGDGDLHLELAGLGDDCPTGINPFKMVVAEATPFFQLRYPSWEALLGKKQSRYLSADHHPEAVVPGSPPLTRLRSRGLTLRVSGLLLRDAHGEGGRTGWEIHPITSLECKGANGEFEPLNDVKQCNGFQP
jgi:hypothetical protein